MRTPLTCAISVLLVFLSHPVLAQNFGQLSGQITDLSSGSGIEQVSVTISGSQVQTNAAGEYSLIGIPAGTYPVYISKEGYEPLAIQDILIGSAYTSHLDVSLRVEGDNRSQTNTITPEYKQIGSFVAYSADEIRRLPVRNLSEIVRTSTGVVAFDGFDELYVRGGSARELLYVVDGIKVGDRLGLLLPQTAIEQVTFESDPLSTEYGDAMSGVVHITTKTGMQQLYGDVEAFTSEALDPFGHTYLSGSVGAPLIKDKIALSISGEYVDQQDSDPRSVGELYVSDEILDDLRMAPMAFRGQLPDGTTRFLPIPASLSEGAELLTDNNDLPLVTNNAITFSDGTTIPLNGVDVTTIDFWRDRVDRAEYVEDFVIRNNKRRRQSEHLSLLGSVTIQPSPGTRLRIGGRINSAEQDDRSSILTRSVLFNPEAIPVREAEAKNLFASFSQRFGRIGFMHIQGSYTDFNEEVYDPRFGRDWDDLLEYGNIDSDVFSTLRGYITPDDFNPFVFEHVYGDGAGPSSTDIHSLVQLTGGGFNSYSQSRTEQFRFSGHVSIMTGHHQISFGAEYEQQTQRFWEIDAFRLARYAADDDVEITLDGFESGLTAYEEFPLRVLEDFVGRQYGYDLRGQHEVNSDDVEAYADPDFFKPLESYNLAPYEPIFYGGFIEDEFSWSDLTIQAGLRVDVFDNNTRVLKDPFASRPICRVGEVDTDTRCGSSNAVHPSMGNDFAVYYQGNSIAGYRDTNGNFYNADGLPDEAFNIFLSGTVRVLSNLINEEMFRSYEPRVTLLPRFGLQFLVNDHFKLFAKYTTASQRPNYSSVSTLESITTLQGVSLQDISPYIRTTIEMGGQFTQRGLGTVNLSGYRVSVEGGSFLSARGIELQVTSVRKNGIQAALSYSLAHAEGSNFSDIAPGEVNLVYPERGPVQTLDIDQRHTIHALLDYRLREGEGPRLGGVHVLENLGINVNIRAGSGFPYTPTEFPINHSVVRPVVPIAEINSLRMPWNARVDVHIERRFFVGTTASFSAFVWVQNVFDKTNINRVWQFTGDHDDDGYLSTERGQEFLTNRQPGAEAVYNHLSRRTDYVGIPRLIRAGVRIDF